MDKLQAFVPILTGEQLIDLLRNVVREEVRDGVRAELATYKPDARKALTLPDLATATQISKPLGVTMATVNNWTKARSQRPARLVAVEETGRRRRYRREDVLALIESSDRLKIMQLNPEGGNVSAGLSIV